MNSQLKKITENEVKELQNISIETFSDTFGDDNSSQNLQEYLHNAYNIDQLKNEINNLESEFQLILYDNKIAGYLKLNIGNAQSENEGNNALEVERIYIKKNFKRHGLGTRLINYAINKAKKFNKSFIWLGVWEYNNAAIKFYNNLGFKAFSDHIFQLGNDKQRDILMKRRLS